MALYSKKEFAELAAMPTRELSVYIKRGKVFTTDDGESLDDQVPQNAAFLEKRAVKKSKAEKKPAGKKTTAKAPEPATPPHILQARQKQYELEQEKKRLEVEKLQTDLDSANINLQKKQGKFLPTDLVMVLFSQFSKQTSVSFHQGVENMLAEIAAIGHLNQNQVAELRGKLKKLVNKCVEKAVDDTQSGLDNLVIEQSEAPNKWERAS